MDNINISQQAEGVFMSLFHLRGLIKKKRATFKSTRTMSNSLPLECFHFHCKLSWDLSGRSVYVIYAW